MAGILDMLSSTFDSDFASKTARAAGIEPSLVTQGIGAIGPVVLGALAQRTATPQGAQAIFKALPQGSGEGWLSGITNLLSGGAAGGQALGGGSIFGAGSNAIAATISEKLGFNVRPLLNIAAPLVLGLLAKAVKSQNLNASGLAAAVRGESDAFLKNPQNKEAASLVHSALAASDKANALRDMFDESEWLKVRRGPLQALYHVATAAMSGPVGLVKEFTAATDAVSEATQTAGPESLVGAAFGDGLAQDQLTQLAQERPESRVVLDGLHESIALIARKSPADAQAYRDVVLNAAQRAAEATKEGGFLGFGGTKVSEAEQRALNDIRNALS
jgi:Bacterial protein of unknown function (DUF937)